MAELTAERVCVLFWAQGRTQTGPSACAMRRQTQTGRCGGGAELQRALPGGAAAAEHWRAWSDRKGGLRPTGPSATGRAGPRGAHRGLRSTGEVAQGGRRQGPSGGDGRRSWGRSMQGISGLLIPTGRLVVLLRRCHRVKRVGKLPAARNRGRGATHRWRSSGGILALHGSGS
jgi:hypothetical protein